jgi:hypothetical protein
VTAGLSQSEALPGAAHLHRQTVCTLKTKIISIVLIFECCSLHISQHISQQLMCISRRCAHHKEKQFILSLYMNAARCTLVRRDDSTTIAFIFASANTHYFQLHLSVHLHKNMQVLITNAHVTRSKLFFQAQNIIHSMPASKAHTRSHTQYQQANPFSTQKHYVCVCVFMRVCVCVCVCV